MSTRIRFPKGATRLERVEFGSFPEPMSGCWLWLGAICKKLGYGWLADKPKVRHAHQVAYEVFKGPVPNGLVIDHTCRTRCCVNPAHLEAVTNRENVLRGNGPSSRCARVTHCPAGHPYIGENLRLTPRGRVCRICCRAARKSYKARRKARLS